MNEQGRILDMLAEGKITTEQAERLLEALDRQSSGTATLVAPSELNEGSDRSDAVEQGDEVVSLSYRNEEQTLTVGDSPTLVVGNTNGAINVQAGQPNEIKVEAKVPSSLKDKYHVTQEGDTVTVHADASRQKRTGIFSIFGISLKIDVDVTIPPETRVELTNRNGRIELSGIRGAAKLMNRNGVTELSETRGTVDIESRNGKLSFHDCEGEITALSRNGPVVMRRVKAMVKVEARNGPITLSDFAGQVDASTANGPVNFGGTFEAGTKNRLVTKNGAIDTDLSAVTDLKLDAETKLGGVTHDIPNLTVTSDGGRSVVGTLGDGSTELVLRSNNGRVSVR